MSIPKYNEFYLISDNNQHLLYDLTKITDEDYIINYDGNIYCPLCKKAQLIKVKGKNKIYLRTAPRQEHGLVDNEICYYAFDSKTTIETERYIRDLSATNGLGRKLESILFKLEKEKTKNNELNSFENKPEIKKSNASYVIRTKRTITPMYSFLNWGINTPLEHLIIAYGVVYVNLRESKERTYVVLYADETKTRLLTSFLKPYYKNIENGYYYIVAVGTCVKHDKYYNFKLFDFYNGLKIKPFSIP